MIIIERTRVVDHDDVDLGFDVPVLETVVHDDHLDFGVFAAQAPDTLDAVLANHDRNLRELHLDHFGFVACHGIVHLWLHLEVSFGLAAVSARKHGYMHVSAQRSDDHFGHRGLAGPADSDVADADYGNVEMLTRTIEQLTYAVAYMSIQAEKSGVGCCIIGALANEMTKGDENIIKELKEQLNLNDKQILLTLLTLGYEKTPKETNKIRKEPAEVIFYEKLS